MEERPNFENKINKFHTVPLTKKVISVMAHFNSSSSLSMEPSTHQDIKYIAEEVKKSIFNDLKDMPDVEKLINVNSLVKIIEKCLWSDEKPDLQKNEKRTEHKEPYFDSDCSQDLSSCKFNDSSQKWHMVKKNFSLLDHRAKMLETHFVHLLNNIPEWKKLNIKNVNIDYATIVDKFSTVVDKSYCNAFQNESDNKKKTHLPNQEDDISSQAEDGSVHDVLQDYYKTMSSLHKCLNKNTPKHTYDIKRNIMAYKSKLIQQRFKPVQESSQVIKKKPYIHELAVEERQGRGNRTASESNGEFKIIRITTELDENEIPYRRSTGIPEHVVHDQMQYKLNTNFFLKSDTTLNLNTHPTFNLNKSPIFPHKPSIPIARFISARDFSKS